MEVRLVYNHYINCYLASILSIAESAGIEYRNAFSRLWSESEFEKNEEHDLFLSKRVYEDIEGLGLEIRRNEAFESITDGELFLVGMDSIYVPWTPHYTKLNALHYFFARKETGKRVACFDPTYSCQNEYLTKDAILKNSFELVRLAFNESASLCLLSPAEEAAEIIRKHPKTIGKLVSCIEESRSDNTETLIGLSKEIYAMQQNRYLYLSYIDLHFNKEAEREPLGITNLFSKDYFLRLSAIRNGIMKAIMKPNATSTLAVTKELLEATMEQELSVARQIVANSP